MPLRVRPPLRSMTARALTALVVVAALVGCGADEGLDAAESTDRPAPTAVAAPTDVPAPTATVAPTAGGDTDADTGADGDPATDDAADPATDEVDEKPIPVEPDGGIGDGAAPLPGADVESTEGDWHGAVVAATNCPGTDFRRVEASAFSFSVPSDFVDLGAQGIDSEVAIWAREDIEVNFDFGWYSGSPAGITGAESTPLDYSGIEGELVVVRDNGGWDGRNLVGAFFPEVNRDGSQPNRLSLIVLHDDPADEIIGRCIVGSVEWLAG